MNNKKFLALLAFPVALLADCPDNAACCQNLENNIRNVNEIIENNIDPENLSIEELDAIRIFSEVTSKPSWNPHDTLENQIQSFMDSFETKNNKLTKYLSESLNAEIRSFKPFVTTPADPFAPEDILKDQPSPQDLYFSELNDLYEYLEKENFIHGDEAQKKAFAKKWNISCKKIFDYLEEYGRMKLVVSEILFQTTVMNIMAHPKNSQNHTNQQ